MNLLDTAHRLRSEMLEMCIKAGDGHVTSSLSCTEIMVALFHGQILRYDPPDPEWEDRDRFILSKAQASPMLYTVLADFGYFEKSAMDKFAQPGGEFGVHLQRSVPGAEITAGSLGMGFGTAVGIAKAAKLNRDLHLTFTLLGDGELYEVNNLIAIVDRNFQCTMDFTENLLALEPLDKKWESFGWEVKRIDGHDFDQIFKALENVRARKTNKPLVIIADTTKGKGIEYISHKPLWHGSAPIKGFDVDMCRFDLKLKRG